MPVECLNSWNKVNGQVQNTPCSIILAQSTYLKISKTCVFLFHFRTDRYVQLSERVSTLSSCLRWEMGGEEWPEKGHSLHIGLAMCVFLKGEF